MHLGFFPNTSSRTLPLRVLLTTLFVASQWGCAVTPGRTTIQSVHTAAVAPRGRPQGLPRHTARPIAPHQPTGPQPAVAPRQHHQLRVPNPTEQLVGTPLPLAGEKVSPPTSPNSPQSPHRPVTAAAKAPTTPARKPNGEVRLVSSEESSPSRSAAESSKDRPRANRLLERARQNLELGFEEEALRLAQIAERLEFSERVRYAAGEESPSQFIDRIWGERRPPLPDFPAAAALAQARRAARMASMAVAGKETPPQAVAPQTSVAADPVPTLRAEPPQPLAAANPDEIEIPQLTDEEFEVLAANAKRFDRSPHRRKSPQRDTAIAHGATGRAAPEPRHPTGAGNDEEDGSTLSPAVVATPSTDDPSAAIEPPAAVEDVAAAEESWPLQMAFEPPPAPSTPLYWNWHRVCLTGFVTGLASLMVLWIWREIERWFHRISRPV